MTEVIESPISETPAHPVARAASTPADVATEAPVPAPPAPAPKVAATVQRPVLGCPAPNFIYAELRANRVLEAFLTPEQKEDFREHDCFITHGAATGHRYMVTSRTNPEQLARNGGRSLYDLDDECAICTHDWDVPAAEEMLTLHLLAQFPAHELFMRRLEHEAV